ncbi:hypothetical protein KMP13_01500 [Epibacterium ulvae]|uniref:hypothetical protein n=1 Tax=Epibacterium ulvae TaxID=1156985 RepID=UPI001BFC1AB6|nr:hypothetical protein [Epibacterium ulvae]MBT8152591.1 hypothetical protein [Epibacterium ulvae]
MQIATGHALNGFTQTTLDVALDIQELVLRRRMLFRLLRGFDFDAPVARNEAISDTVPAWMQTPEFAPR